MYEDNQITLMLTSGTAAEITRSINPACGQSNNSQFEVRHRTIMLGSHTLNNIMPKTAHNKQTKKHR